MNKKIIISLLSLVLLSGITLWNVKSISAKTVSKMFTVPWTVNEHATDLTVSNVGLGGVGTVEYYTVPEEGTVDVPMGNPDGPIYNSVRIPYVGYDFDYKYLNIKYEANFPVGGQNITVYCGQTADVGTDGEDLQHSDKLVGWFENWNVTSGQTKDGYKYVQIDSTHYTGYRTIDSIVLNFNYVGNPTSLKQINILGVTFTEEGETPVFETDPKPFTLSNPIGATQTDKDIYKVDVNGSSIVTFDANYWTNELYEMICFNAMSSSNMDVKVLFDDEFVTTIQTTNNERGYEIAYTENSLSQIKLEITGNGTLYFKNCIGTTKPKITNWSTTNTSYFDLIEESDLPEYQMHFKRNQNAGYPKFVVSIENWREEYNVLCCDIYAKEGISLCGIYLTSNTSILSHWSSDNFLLPGKTYHFTFNDPMSLDSKWDGKSLIFYANCNSLQVPGYDYVSEFYINFSFMKSSDLTQSSITVSKEIYEYDFDGTAKSINPLSFSPSNAVVTTTYINGKKESKEAPVDPGEYTVRFKIDGTREYASCVKEVKLIINSKTQSVPTSGYVLDYGDRTFTFESSIEASYSNTFDTLIDSGSKVNENSTIYIRAKAKAGYLPSEYIEITTPCKSTKVVEIVTTSIGKTKIVVQSESGVEYRLINGTSVGEWKDSGTFIGLKEDRLYKIEARTKGSAECFSSDIVTIPVRTLSSEVEEQPTKTSGCGKGSVACFVTLCLMLCLGQTIIRRKKY